MPATRNNKSRDDKASRFKKNLKDLLLAIICISIILIFGVRVLSQAGVSKGQAVIFLRDNLYWICIGFGGVVILNSFAREKKLPPAIFGLILVLTGSGLCFIQSHPVKGFSWHRKDQSMAWINPGSVTYTNSYGQIKTISIDHGFWIDSNEVIGQARSQRDYWRAPKRQTSRRSPLVYISWQSANQNCELATKNAIAKGHLPKGYNYRLPTTNEWIYASLYDKRRSLDSFEQPIFQNGFRTRPSSVTDEDSNKGRLLHMEGNVWEWCLENVPAPLDSLAEAPNQSEYKAAIGGGWTSPQELCRPDSIISLNEYDAFKFVGYRMVLSKKQE